MAQVCVSFYTNAAAEPRLFGQINERVLDSNSDHEPQIHGSAVVRLAHDPSEWIFLDLECKTLWRRFVFLSIQTPQSSDGVR